MKSKYKVIRIICVISSIILALCFLIGNIESKKLMPYIILNLLVFNFSSYKENEPSKEYKKYEGIKVILANMLFFFAVIMVMVAFR